MYYSMYTGVIYAWGVKLVLCGKPTTPEGLAISICGEKDAFRVSLVYDEQGKLTEVRYDRLA